MDRSSKIVRISLIGILANVVLAGFKAAVGFLSGSIAVVLDALNNLSDAFSSVVTIVGTKLANRPPDRKHPYGHGRVEYISSVTIGVIVLIAGVTSFREAVEAILKPEKADYNVVSFIVIGAAVAVKLILGRYVKKSGEKLNSESLVASGTDALFDAAVSLSTLVGAALSIFFSLNLEGWLGAVISVLIVKAGAEILLESLSGLIGSRVDGELTGALREKVAGCEGVEGVYDLILHRYGPEKYIGSVHVQVSDRMTAREIHILTRKITEEVYREFGIVLTVGIYASGDGDPESAGLREKVDEITSKHKEILGIHGFYLEPGTNRVSFDMVVDFGTDTAALYREVLEEVSSACPGYYFDIILDSDFSD